MGHIIGRGRYRGETYPGTGSSGNPAAGIVPLSRQRFIDGDTGQTGLNGSVAEPFKTVAEFMAARGNASTVDATANFVGWVMPSLIGYPEDVFFPPRVSTELRADSLTPPGVTGTGTSITGNVSWANTGGPHAADSAAVVMHNVSVTGTFTVTDLGDAPASAIFFGGDEIGDSSVVIGGGFDSHTTTKLASVSFTNAIVGGDITAGTAATSAAVFLFNSNVIGSITANILDALNSDIDAIAITVGTTTTPAASFFNCVFQTGSTPVLTATTGASFDGPSWQSFAEAGGTRAAGTFALVVGGYDGGAVEGATLTGNSTNVSLNGTGATAGYTAENSGNHYSSASNTPTSVTLKTGGGELIGDTMLITRTTLGTGVLAVHNNAAAVIGTIPVNARGSVKARFDGNDWVFVEGGSMLA